MVKRGGPVELARLNALFRGFSDANKSSQKVGFRISATKMWLLLHIDICVYIRTERPGSRLILAGFWQLRKQLTNLVSLNVTSLMAFC